MPAGISDLRQLAMATADNELEQSRKYMPQGKRSAMAGDVLAQGKKHVPAGISDQQQANSR